MHGGKLNMIYEEAFEKAKQMIENEYQTVTEVVEFSDYWIFLGGAKNKGETIVGVPNLKITKDTGSIEYFPIPPISNLDLLDEGISIYKI